MHLPLLIAYHHIAYHHIAYHHIAYHPVRYKSVPSRPISSPHVPSRLFPSLSHPFTLLSSSSHFTATLTHSISHRPPPLHLSPPSTKSSLTAIQVWDRRTLGLSALRPRPIGCFAGHKQGIAFIDGMGDSRWVLIYYTLYRCSIHSQPFLFVCRQPYLLVIRVSQYFFPEHLIFGAMKQTSRRYFLTQSKDNFIGLWDLRKVPVITLPGYPS